MREPVCLPCHLADVHDEPHLDCVIWMSFPADSGQAFVDVRCQCECQDPTPGQG